MARVLILEPEPDLLLLAGEALVELGHAVVCAAAAEAGAPVDVMLVAWEAELPELVGRLRAGAKPLPFVGVGNGPVTPQLRALGAAAYLVKPYSLGELDRALRHALT